MEGLIQGGDVNLDEISQYVFMGADEDGNGYIDSSELHTYWENIGMSSLISDINHRYQSNYCWLIVK